MPFPPLRPNPRAQDPHSHLHPHRSYSYSYSQGGGRLPPASLGALAVALARVLVPVLFVPLGNVGGNGLRDLNRVGRVGHRVHEGVDLRGAHARTHTRQRYCAREGRGRRAEGGVTVWAFARPVARPAKPAIGRRGARGVATTQGTRPISASTAAGDDRAQKQMRVSGVLSVFKAFWPR